MAKNQFTKAICDNCSAPLKITGDEKVVVCEFCNTSHIVPQELLDLMKDSNPKMGSSIKHLRDNISFIEEEREKFNRDTQHEINELHAEREKRTTALNKAKRQKIKSLIISIITGLISAFLLLFFSVIYISYLADGKPLGFLEFFGAGITITVTYFFIRNVFKFRSADKEKKSRELDLETTYSLENIERKEKELSTTDTRYGRRMDEMKKDLDNKIGV